MHTMDEYTKRLGCCWGKFLIMKKSILLIQGRIIPLILIKYLNIP